MSVLCTFTAVQRLEEKVRRQKIYLETEGDSFGQETMAVAL